MGCGCPWSLWRSCCSGGFCNNSHCLDPALRHTMTLHTIIRPFIHSFFHACICSIAHSLTNSLTHSLAHLLSLTHPIIFVNTCLDKLLCNTFSESIIWWPLHGYLDASSKCRCICPACADYNDMHVYHSLSAITTACPFTRHCFMNL